MSLDIDGLSVYNGGGCQGERVNGGVTMVGMVGMHEEPVINKHDIVDH